MTPERQEGCGGKPGKPREIYDAARMCWMECPDCPDCEVCPTCKGPKDEPKRRTATWLINNDPSGPIVCPDPFHDSPP